MMLLSQREKINIRLQQIIDQQTEPWGVKVTHVEVKQIDLPQEMQRAMAKQAEAERERRAKVISAEGEFQASQRLSDAAKILSEQPSALTLRYLQTLREIATENNSTTIFPVPIDILKPFMKINEDEPKEEGKLEITIMILKELRLRTNHLSILYNFYKEVLELPTVYSNEKSITILAGTSKLIFEETSDIDNPFYHFAFNIPSNKFEEAFQWMNKRVELLWP